MPALHLGSRFRTFVELGSYWEDGREPASRPIDVGDLELSQAFLDVTALDRALSRLTLRLGRQELPVGSGRLVSIRDGANVRLSFDAAKLNWVRARRTLFEASAGRPVVPKPGVFASETSHREWFWYGDLTRLGTASGRPAVELFYVGHALRSTVVDGTTRHSLGGRSVGPHPGTIPCRRHQLIVRSADIGLGWAHETGGRVSRVAPPSPAAIGEAEQDLQRTLRPELLLEAAIFAPEFLTSTPTSRSGPPGQIAATAGVDLAAVQTSDDHRAGGGIRPPIVSDARFVTGSASSRLLAAARRSP